MVRCKIIVAARKESIGRSGNVFSVELVAVMATEGEESVFGKYTPHFDLKLDTLDMVVADQFTPGKTFYLDIFTPEEANDLRPESVVTSLLIESKTETLGDEPQWGVTMQRATGLAELRPETIHGQYGSTWGTATIKNESAARQLQTGRAYHGLFTPVQ